MSITSRVQAKAKEYKHYDISIIFSKSIFNYWRYNIMSNILIGFFMATLCWLVSCIIGALLIDAFIPANGIPLTTFDGLVFVAIGWIVFNHNSKDKDYQTSFNIWMTILYVPTLLSIL